MLLVKRYKKDGDGLKVYFCRLISDSVIRQDRGILLGYATLIQPKKTKKHFLPIIKKQTKTAFVNTIHIKTS